MSRNGSGTYSLPPGNPVVTGTTISSSWANNTLSDIATALTQSIAYDGQTTPTANLPMGGFKHTGVAVGSALTDYARYDQMQNSSAQWLTGVTGIDTITASASVAPASYSAGQTFKFVSAGANTGAVTLNVSSLGAKSVTKNGTTALSAGNIPSGAVVEVIYDGTQFQLINVYFSTVGLASSGANSDITSLSAITIINSDGIIGRNRFMNGDMRRSSYNGTTAVTPLSSSITYIIDRWAQSITQSSKLTFQQVADAPAGFKYSLKVSVAAQYSPLATDQFYLTQKVEGQVITDFQFGAAGAAVVTLSQYIKGSVAGTYSCALVNGAANRSYVGTISVTNSWARAQITLTGDTAGTWATDNTVGLYLIIDLGSGSNFNATAGSWQAGLFTRTSGSVTFVNQTVGSTLNITGVQLELGSVATQWKQHYGIFGGEDQSCQRYYLRYKSLGANHVFPASGGAGSATSGYVVVSFPVQMRIPPVALEQSGTPSDYRVLSGSGTVPLSSVPTFQASSEISAKIGITVSGGLGAGQALGLDATNANAYLGFSAEL